jgi:hypothetical protein
MILDSYTCEICVVQRVKTLRHLFLHCSFAKNCWTSIGVLVPTWLSVERATAYMKRHINQPFVMEIIMIISWCIWKERNAWLFSNEDLSVQHCKDSFKSEFALTMLRAKQQKASIMSQRLENLS